MWVRIVAPSPPLIRNRPRNRVVLDPKKGTPCVKKVILQLVSFPSDDCLDIRWCYCSVSPHIQTPEIRQRYFYLLHLGTHEPPDHLP